jgi:hypothetical protein
VYILSCTALPYIKITCIASSSFTAAQRTARSALHSSITADRAQKLTTQCVTVTACFAIPYCTLLLLQNVAPWMSALHSAFAVGALTAPVAVGLFQPLLTFIALAAIAAPTGAAAVWLGCHKTARDCGKLVVSPTALASSNAKRMADLGAGGWRRISGTWVHQPLRRSK